jgi:hypothetical protein
MYSAGVLYFTSTILVMIFKKEKECTELKLTMLSTYVTIWHILKISSMWKLIVILLTVKV